jgi:hypothetical protein
MTIPTTEYKGFEMRAYSQMLYPDHNNPYGSGPRKFSSVVSIDTIPASGDGSRRYGTDFHGAYPAVKDDAINLAMEYGRNIIDGKVQSHQL